MSVLLPSARVQYYQLIDGVWNHELDMLIFIFHESGGCEFMIFYDLMLWDPIVIRYTCM